MTVRATQRNPVSKTTTATTTKRKICFTAVRHRRYYYSYEEEAKTEKEGAREGEAGRRRNLYQMNAEKESVMIAVDVSPVGLALRLPMCAILITARG